MKIPCRFAWVALILFGAGSASSIVLAQSLEPANDPSPGMRQLPPIPGGGPDPFSKYRTDPSALRALREQAHLSAELRQKQLRDAANLLLKIARELRADVAANPKEISKATEFERLKQIRKLSSLIQDREKEQDPVATNLAKEGQLE